MNRTATKTALFSAVAMSAAFAAQSASAAHITAFDYVVNSAFTSFTETGGSGPNPGSVSGSNPNPELGGNTTLSWGDQEGDTPSSVSITSQVTSPPQLIPGEPAGSGPGAPVPGATFTHTNNVIPASSSILDTFQITTQLDLTAAASATPSSIGAMEQVGPITFSSFFTETFNEDSLDQCAAGSVSLCDDIFVLSNADDLGALGQGQSFTIDGFLYTVFLNIEELGQLTDEQCAAAGASTGCVGFATQENQVNSFDTSFSIAYEPVNVDVPEPGSLALLGLGLGLVGFGYARRRSNGAI